MRYGKWLAGLLAAAMLALPSGGEARESHFEGGSEEIEDEPIETKDTREAAWEESEVHADDWFTNPSKKEDYGSDEDDGSGTDEDEEEKKKKARFIEICRDESFIYKMDRKTAHYTRIPHTIDEKMIDVWVKLEPLETAPGEYTYPPKYYLEHYLIRPKRKQIQFLCEMEVSGRPGNDAAEDKIYDPRRWERLIPGSIEDTIYHAILQYKGKIYDESTANGKSARDYIENTFNISL
ncbi:MAG: hypothetical protein IJ741_09320 [Schwartzia sp.]|nr:hypothetical protein [Schwartzia sp. (in: firmicutes)]